MSTQIKWVELKRRSTRDMWLCHNQECPNEEPVYVTPDWYENNGTPVCEECDSDMSYHCTEIGFKHYPSLDISKLDCLAGGTY